MRRTRCWLAAICLLGIACGSKYRQGDTYKTGEVGRLFYKQKSFQDSVDRFRAGVKSLEHDEDCAYLDMGVRVRVVESVDGGAKVVVLDGKYEGALGWIPDDDLKDGSKQEP